MRAWAIEPKSSLKSFTSRGRKCPCFIFEPLTFNDENRSFNYVKTLKEAFKQLHLDETEADNYYMYEIQAYDVDPLMEHDTEFVGIATEYDLVGYYSLDINSLLTVQSTKVSERSLLLKNYSERQMAVGIQDFERLLSEGKMSSLAINEFCRQEDFAKENFMRLQIR